MHAVTRRLHIAPAEQFVGRGNRRATAGEREFGALTPGNPLLTPAGLPLSEHLTLCRSSSGPTYSLLPSTKAWKEKPL